MLSPNFNNFNAKFNKKKTAKRRLFSASINISNSNNFENRLFIDNNFFNFEVNNLNDFGNKEDQEITAIINNFRQNSTPTLLKKTNFDDELGSDFLDEDVQVASASSNSDDYKNCLSNDECISKNKNFIEESNQLTLNNNINTIDDNDIPYQPTKSIASKTQSVLYNMLELDSQTILKQNENSSGKRKKNNSFSTSISNNLKKKTSILTKLRCLNCSPLTATIAAVASAKPTINNKNKNYKRQLPAKNLLKQTDNLQEHLKNLSTTKQSTSPLANVIRPNPICLTKNNIKSKQNFNKLEQKKKKITKKVNFVESADSGISKNRNEILYFNEKFPNYSSVSCY